MSWGTSSHVLLHLLASQSHIEVAIVDSCRLSVGTHTLQAVKTHIFLLANESDSMMKKHFLRLLELCCVFRPK